MATNLTKLVWEDLFIFCDTATYVPTVNDILTSGTPTKKQWNITGLLNGEARESDKVDLGNGSAVVPPLIAVFAGLEWFTTAADDGTKFDFHWAPSDNSNAAVGNPGIITGSDADWTLNEIELKQMWPIGSLVCRNTLDVQKGLVGIFSPPFRYGGLLGINRTGQTVAVTDVVETGVLFKALVPQLQADV